MKRSVSSKDVQQQNEWKFDLAIGGETNLRTYVKVSFLHRESLNMKFTKTVKSNRPTNTLPQCFIGAEKNPEASINVKKGEVIVYLYFVFRI